MKAVIYSRISKEDQSAYSLEGQVEECEKYVKKEGYELVDTYIDDGFSAKNLKRPSIQRLLDDLKAKKFNMIVVWRLDRLTRETIDGLDMVKNVFRPNGVEFASVTEDIDTSTPDGYMMYTIRLSMAQNEREKIAERVTLGQIRRARKGKRNTSAKPYGYDVNEDLSLSVNEEEAEIVQRIFNWYVGGYGRNKIASILNDEHIPAPRGGLWKDKTIGDLIRNVTYIGAVHYQPKNGERILVHECHEPIISEEIFSHAQEVAQRRSDHEMNTSSYDFAFSTIVKCGKCGRSYHGKQKTKVKWGTQTRHYRCSGKYRQDGCDASDISEIKLTSLFLEFISNFTFETEKADQVVDGKDVKKEIKRLEKLMSDSSTKRKNYARAMGSGKMDYETYVELVDEETSKVKRWQEELDTLRENTPEIKRTRKDVLQIFEGLTNRWNDMSVQQQKAAVNTMFKFIVIRKLEDEWNVVAYKLNDR